MDDIRTVILDFIEREYELPKDVDYDTFNYVKTGYVDSMGIIQFVAVLEEEFDVEFSAEELKSYSFQTIGGLEKIIKSKLNDKN